MMNLFTITETFEIELNKEWIMMIPEFAAILRADKGSKGDSEGRKKLQARKLLGYVYFMRDFKSPIYSWVEEEKAAEALRYTDLTTSEVEAKLVQDALAVYQEMQQKQARSLRTLEAANKGMDALDNYLNGIDFTQTDKQGKLLNSPKEFVDNLKNLNKAYDELQKFEERVLKDLQENATIRGQQSLGDKEHKRENSGGGAWDESGPEQGSGGMNFSDLSVFQNRTKQAAAGKEEEE